MSSLLQQDQIEDLGCSCLLSSFSPSSVQDDRGLRWVCLTLIMFVELMDDDLEEIGLSLGQ